MTDREITGLLQWVCILIVAIAARWWIIDNLGIGVMFAIAISVGISGIVIARDIAENHREDDGNECNEGNDHSDTRYDPWSIHGGWDA